jgi:DNA-binding GntR family transcriptional regulator
MAADLKFFCLIRGLQMTTETLSELESRIIRFLADPDHTHDLPQIVNAFREMADEASVKAALHRLSAEGLLQITPEWQFRTAAAGAR